MDDTNAESDVAQESVKRASGSHSDESIDPSTLRVVPLMRVSKQSTSAPAPAVVN